VSIIRHVSTRESRRERVELGRRDGKQALKTRKGTRSAKR
jgi:hypothetical protein